VRIDQLTNVVEKIIRESFSEARDYMIKRRQDQGPKQKQMILTVRRIRNTTEIYIDGSEFKIEEGAEVLLRALCELAQKMKPRAFESLIEKVRGCYVD